jgi:hypothetical protein
MSNIVPDTWNISGNVVGIDGSTPFGHGTITAFDLYNGQETSLNGSGLDSNGNFSITFSRSLFQNVDPSRTAPSVILRVYDYQNRILRQSEVFTPPHAVSFKNLVLDRMPIPDVWNVSGFAFNQNGTSPFNQGLIYIYCKKQDGTEHELTHTGLNWDGRFTLTFSRQQFQFGDVEILAPNAIFKIFNYQNQLLWQYGPIVLPSSEYYINPHVGGAIIPDIPVVPDNWSVSGVLLENGLPVSQNFTVKAFDTLYGVETELGSVQTGPNGTYLINYNKSTFQKGDTGRIAPNLFVRVFLNGDEIAKSGVLHQAGNHSVINIDDICVPDIPVVPDDWSVAGTVLKDGHTPSAPLTVKAFDRFDDANETELGAAVQTNPDGTYKINYTKSAFQNIDSGRVSPNLFIRVFSGADLVAASEIFYSSATHAVINISFTSSDTGVPEDWSVSGIVLEDGKVFPTPLTVKAFDRFPNQNETLLGEISTGSNGSYTINYKKFAFQSHDSGRVSPNLFIRVFSGDVLVATSNNFNPAATHAVINVNFVPLDWELSGKITKADETSMSSWRIDVWDVYLCREFPIGSTGLNSDGGYSIAFAKDKFELENMNGDEKRRHPDLLVRIYDPDGVMAEYYYLPYENSTKYRLDVDLEPVTNVFRVSGKVLNQQGYPVSDNVVIVKNILLREDGVFQEIELGRGISGPAPSQQGTQRSATPGAYSVSFQPELVRVGNEKAFASTGSLASARFVVEVHTVSGQIAPMDYPLGPLEFAGRSNLLKAADEKFSADFVIDAPSDVDVSTYTHIHKQLLDRGFTANSIIDLASDESKLEYAVDLTGAPREEILIIALAKFIFSELSYQLKHVSHTNIPCKVNPQIMYALVKTGNAVSFQDLLKITADKLQTVLISAITQSIIPPSVQRELSCIVAEWRVIYSILLKDTADISNAGRIFRYAMPKPKNSADCGKDDVCENRDACGNCEINKYSVYYGYYLTVVNVYAETAHDLAKFWAELKEALTEDKVTPAVIDSLINRIKFFFDIHWFADEFGPLSNAMMEYADEKDYTALDDFVDLERADWLGGVIGRIVIRETDEVNEWPESVPGESDDEKRSNYAAILYRRIVGLFAMERFRSDLDEAVGGEEFDNSEWWRPVLEFLDINEALDFADTITDGNFHYTPGSTEEEIEALYGKLLTVQRIYRLTPKFEVIDNLIQNDFTSAMSIAHKNCDEFVKQCSELAGGTDDAQALHAAAVHTASQALFLMGTFNHQTDLPEPSIPAVTERFSEQEKAAPAGFMASPSPMGFMPASSFTVAENERSSENEVFSTVVNRAVPNIAALFGPQNQSLCEDCQSVFSPSAYMVDLLEFSDDKVRSELFSRRPDLSETDLSCRNTHGAVAYIDLVNEILEDAVCSRSFYLTDSIAKGFFITLMKAMEEKSSFAIEDILPDGAEISSNVTAEFGNRGFYIDKKFYVQGIKKGDDDEESVYSKWYIVGDGWRHQVESFAVEPSAPSEKFLITPYPQTGKDAQLRRAKPEHTHWGAYNVLKHPLYPAILPFNLPFTEVNEFLKLKNSNRHKLYHVLTTPGEAFDSTESGMLAFFEMTDKQKSLISADTVNTDTKIKELWGFSADSDMLDLLGNAESVMKKLDISLDRFFDLTHTYLVARPYSVNHPYLDWGEGHAYENGELDQLLIKNCALEDYSRIVCLQRLSSHLGLNVMTADRLISMQRLEFAQGQVFTEIDDSALINLFGYLKIAEEFSVSPIRAASWLCCWIENFNLGRGGPSQFEEIFLSNIDVPQRLAVWKDMMNDTLDRTTRNFETGDANDKDIAILLKSLKVSYHDLLLIAQKEFNSTSTKAEAILRNVNLTITNLAKMFRAADFSKVLGISVSDFYTLKSILAIDFTPKSLIECRSFLARLKRSKISIDEFHYLLSGHDAAKISWLPADGDEEKTIAKIRDEVTKTKNRYAEDAADSTEAEEDTVDLSEAIEKTILNELAAIYKIPVDTCETVLTETLKADSGESLLQHWVDICTAENVADGTEGYLDKIANVSFLIRTLNIVVNDFGFLTDYLRSVYQLDFNTLGASSGVKTVKYESLVSLLDVYILNGELPFKNKNYTIFDLLREAQKPREIELFVEVAAREIDWPHDDISKLVDLFKFNLVRIESWSSLNRSCGLLKKLGLTASFADTLIAVADNSPSQSEALISALRASYTQSQWIEAAEPVRNNLRRRQRDALCAYLLSERSETVTTNGFEASILNSLLNYKLGKNELPDRNNNLMNEFLSLCGLSNTGSSISDDVWGLLDGRTGPVNRAAIYAKYLIDVDMDTDVKTTRIVQANSSIQMFLQRALLNFENIELDDKIKQPWSWMKNYRLWEANRKIFLYPENWLESEFRDDKTPLFKELESAILQKELNPSNVQEAFKAYTSGLSDVANLEVIGAYEEEGQGGKILHVVGRTFHYPHSYYYRRNHDFTGGSGYWTPWEKVDLDITADVVLPVPFRNKVYIFWPMIELKEKSVENDTKDADAPQYLDTFKYYEIKLVWSELSDGKWSAKRISQNSYLYVAESADNELVKPTDLFHFRAEIRSDEVEIHVFAYNKTFELLTVKTKVLKNIEVRGLFGKKRKIKIPVIENQIVKGDEIETINRIAAFSFGSDNNARLIPIEDEYDYMQSKMIPPGTAMCHNRAEESEERQNSGDFGALEYPVGNVLLGQTPEQFICFPVNLSFFDNTVKPLFLRLNEKTLFIKPVPSPNILSLNSNVKIDSMKKLKQVMLDYRNTTFHQITNFYHPLADDLLRRANRNSIDDLLNRSVQANTRDQYPLGYAAVGDEHAKHLANLSFQYRYLPQKAILGDFPAPVNDFSLNSAFGVYNWELFFHLPMYIATRLSRDNQYEEAMRWFHYIFNPSIDFTDWEKSQRWTWDLPDGARFWNFLPFFANRGVQDSIYKAVEKSQIQGEDTKLGNLIEDWKNDPFKPHLIARVRTAAYQKAVVMKYLDNLIGWGDSLFRLDNMESINEATQLYTHASEILGERPVLVPKLHEMPGLTYTQLKAEGLDQFSNTVIQLENYIPPAPPVKVRLWRAKQAPSRYYYYHYNYNYTYNSSVEAIPHRSVQLLRMAPALHYFCIPRNQRLISYWDVVEDRLFKIRHSMNIDGVKRVMPLFAPPIDPGMLARALAMGMSIDDIFNDTHRASTVYRFTTVFQKALELCNELKAFGSELLSALEKKDAEGLAVLRNNHEVELLRLIKDIKKKTVEESTQNLEALLKTKSITEERYNYYKDIERISEGESNQLTALNTAAAFNMVGQAMVLASGPIKLIPDLCGGALVGLTGGAIVFSKLSGGEKTSDALGILGNAINQTAGIFDRLAGISSIKASYERRWEEWKLQEQLAKKELTQIDKQILSAQIRIQIAENDLSNHDKQIEQALSVKEVMESKFSNEKLYQWMVDELTKSYNTMYDIAYRAAKKAEKAFEFELGDKMVFVTPEIWSSAKNGLLAGNRLSVQLRQMDAAYIENNKRELEITKAVSLSMLNPEQLLILRETGSCEFELPELIYDFDFPGQYFRRIKSVRVTVPCVAGPYTNISAKLALLNSRIRVDAASDGDYEEDLSESGLDGRFRNLTPAGGMSISTSNATMDSGMFDFNFRDERYLPFEGAGAIGRWRLELPADYRQFDYGTITDVILHISYTAREAADSGFKEHVIEHLNDYLTDQKFIPNLISLSQSFECQLESIVNGGIGEISLNENEHFPHLVVDYWRRKNNQGLPNISELKVFVLLKNGSGGNLNFEIKINEKLPEGSINRAPNLYELVFKNIGNGLWNFKLDKSTDEIEDIFLYFGYSVSGENETA